MILGAIAILMSTIPPDEGADNPKFRSTLLFVFWFFHTLSPSICFLSVLSELELISMLYNNQ